MLAVDDGWKRIGISETTVQQHMNILLAHPAFAERLRTIYERKKEFPPSIDPEAQLYDGFLTDRDALRVEVVRNATENELADFHPEFTDERLAPLLLHYKARNFPRSLTESEASTWEEWRADRIRRHVPSFVASLARIAKTADDNQRFMCKELKLWLESVMPTDDQ